MRDFGPGGRPVAGRPAWSGVLVGLVVAIGLLANPGGQPTDRPAAAEPSGQLNQIEHVIIIFMENWSFDSLYGTFVNPVSGLAANGIANATPAQKTQIDPEGKPYPTLPLTLPNGTTIDVPNGPFNLSPYIPPTRQTGGVTHLFHAQQYAINRNPPVTGTGQQNRYATYGWPSHPLQLGALPLSYYEALNLEGCRNGSQYQCTGQLAVDYTLLDNFFHAAYGNSYLNHLWLLCACTPEWIVPPGTAPPDLTGCYTEAAHPTTWGSPLYAVGGVTYTVNLNTCHGQFAPTFTNPTIVRKLQQANVSWKWYGRYGSATDPGMVLPLFSDCPWGSPCQTANIPAITTQNALTQTIQADLASGNWPAVAWIRPLQTYTEHPADGTLVEGERFVYDTVRQIQQSPIWSKSVIIITYDEDGGRWDHVPPPAGIDGPNSLSFGAGARVPAIVVSPFARRNFVDSTFYDMTSIIKFIERVFNLPGPSLVTRRYVDGRVAGDLTNALNLSSPATPTPTATPGSTPPNPTPNGPGAAVGVVSPGTGRWALRRSYTTGPAEVEFQYGPVGPAGGIPFMGDWNGDGITTPGLYDPSTGLFFLRNSNTSGVADITFTFGPAFPVTATTGTWLPVVGDWTGAGSDRVGLYDPATSVFYLRNSLTTGQADTVVVYGTGDAGLLPVTGNWIGSTGSTTKVGLYDPATSRFFLRHTLSTGQADTVVTLGEPRQGFLPLGGTWLGERASVGLYQPRTNEFFLRLTPTTGPAEVQLGLTGVGGSGLRPVVGRLGPPPPPRR